MPSLFSTFSHIQTPTLSLDELSISRKDPNSETIDFFLWGEPDCKTDADHFNANLLAGQSYVSGRDWNLPGYTETYFDGSDYTQASTQFTPL